MRDKHENFFLQAIVESYPDGIVIADNYGSVVAANQSARQICTHLSPEGLQVGQLPAQIWRICRSLFENYTEFEDIPVMIEDQIELQPMGHVRIRVQWFIPDAIHPCVLVTLEDTWQGARNRAMVEQRKYGLTAREMEVHLLRLGKCTYRTIAEKLHIEINTVKKHVKNINVKLSESM